MNLSKAVSGGFLADLWLRNTYQAHQLGMTGGWGLDVYGKKGWTFREASVLTFQFFSFRDAGEIPRTGRHCFGSLSLSLS